MVDEHHTNDPQQQLSEDGIPIPYFLRELLGMDFVPSPRPCHSIENNSHSIASEQGEEKTDTIETEETDVVHQRIPDEETHVQQRHHLQHLVIDTITTLDSNCNPQPHQTPNNKSTKTPRKLSTFMKSIRRQRSSSSKVHSATENPLETSTGSNRIQKLLLSPSSKASFQEKPTPKRKGHTTTSSSSSSLSTSRTDDDDDRMVEIPFLQKQLQELKQHQNCLASLKQMSKDFETRARDIALYMAEMEQEAAHLQMLLERRIHRYENEKENLHHLHDTLAQLEDRAGHAARAVETSIRSLQNGVANIAISKQMHHNDKTVDADKENISTLWSNPIQPQSHPQPSSCKTMEVSKTPCSNAFMRVNDLPTNDSHYQQQELSSLSSHSSSWNSVSPLNKDLSMEHIFHLDQNLSWVLDQLFEFGYGIVTDESDRFQPTRETARILKQDSSSHADPHASDCPVRPWHAAQGSQVLTWIGKVDHNGFGHDWPVVKARGIVRASPRTLLEFLKDSSQVQKYVKFSQGREDVLVLQDGIDTLPHESEFGFAGAAKIVRSLLKPRMLPKSIEVLSLWYARSLMAVPKLMDGAYMVVSRSVWEDDSGATQQLPSTNHHHHNRCHSDRIRSEMLLGVQLLRPCTEGCEITTITHVYSPVVPEVMAKNAAPSNATQWIRDIQALFC